MMLIIAIASELIELFSYDVKILYYNIILYPYDALLLVNGQPFIASVVADTQTDTNYVLPPNPIAHTVPHT